MNTFELVWIYIFKIGAAPTGLKILMQSVLKAIVLMIRLARHDFILESINF